MQRLVSKTRHKSCSVLVRGRVSFTRYKLIAPEFDLIKCWFSKTIGADTTVTASPCARTARHPRVGAAMPTLGTAGGTPATSTPSATARTATSEQRTTVAESKTSHPVSCDVRKLKFVKLLCSVSVIILLNNYMHMFNNNCCSIVPKWLLYRSSFTVPIHVILIADAAILRQDVINALISSSRACKFSTAWTWKKFG